VLTVEYEVDAPESKATLLLTAAVVFS
jgi:hypothetical protein